MTAQMGRHVSAMAALRRAAARPVRSAMHRLGYDVVPRRRRHRYPPDIDEATIAIAERVRPYTLTSVERIAALREATRYVVLNDVPGAFAECGVWRGGSMQVVAMTLLECGVDDRDLYLYDTFGWLPRPDERDTDIHGRSALADWEQYDRHGLDAVDEHYHWLPLDEVREALLATGYPAERLHFVVGDVRETLPDHAPDQLALLRLDTDYYDSTRHELVHLEPRVNDGGIVLVDDYGHFTGARDAVDEYYGSREEAVLMHRVDYTARMIMVRRASPVVGAHSTGVRVRAEP